MTTIKYSLEPAKKAQFIKVVKEKAKGRYEQIPFPNCINNAFELKEQFTLTEETAPLATRFFHDTFLPSYQQLGKGIRKVPDKERQFQILLAHLVFATTIRPLRLGMNTTWYAEFRWLSAFIIELVEWLVEHKCLLIRKGVSFKTVSHLTCVSPTKAFRRELLSQLVVRNDLDKNPDPYRGLVEMKGTRKRKIKRNGVEKLAEKPPRTKCPEGKFTTELQKKIRAINDCNSRHRIVVKRNQIEKPIITDLHAVFNKSSFDYGGRFYTGIFGYQAVRSNFRRHIKIDGNDTVELDFSAFHPTLLYALKGIELEHDFDPYTVVFPDRTIRKFLKILLLTIFNCDDQLTAIQAGNDELKGMKNMQTQLRKSRLTVKILFEMFVEAHEPIAEYFFSSYGLRLQRLDSEIALNVLKHFSAKGEACLCIHDSFIVEERLEDELQETMKKYYGKITEKYSPDQKVYRCRIDRKE